MKWRLYNLANILNLLSIVSFFVLIGIILVQQHVGDYFVLFLFLVAGICTAVKDLMAIRYLKILNSDSVYLGTHKYLYVVLAIIQGIAAAFLSYGLTEMGKQFHRFYLDWTFISGFAIFSVFCLTSFTILVIDFFLFPALNKHSDLSARILQNEMQD